MKVSVPIAVALLVASSGLTWQLAQARASEIGRTQLARRDLSIPGHELVQVRVDFSPGAAFGAHTHPGEELAYVLKGSLEYRVAGKPPIILTAGETLFIPAGTVHSARNVGRGHSSELATYVVKKGMPLVAIK